MQKLSAKVSRSMRKLDRFDLPSIDEISLPFHKRPAQDGTSTRRPYPFLKSFLCRRSRIAFNGVNGRARPMNQREKKIVSPH